MKRRILSILICLCITVVLLPTTAFAAATPLKHVDIVIDLPQAGEENGIEVELNAKSITSGNIDLLSKGVYILESTWEGDNIIIDTDELYEEQFRAGTTYLVTMRLAFPTDGSYCANYTSIDGATITTENTFSATVNGVPATVCLSAPYFPMLQVNLTTAGERYTEAEKTQLNQQLDAKASFLAQAKRAVMYTPRTYAEATSNQLENLATEVSVVTKSVWYPENVDKIHTFIVDVDNVDDFSFDIFHGETFPPYLKEVWLCDKVDVYTFVRKLAKTMYNRISGLYRWEERSDLPLCTAETTIFIPESAVASLKESLSIIPYNIPCTIKTYSGNDVYAAQKAGAAAANANWCTDHKYNSQIRSADRVCTYAQGCKYAERYYWSCSICGKCEKNPNHVSTDSRWSADRTAMEKLLEKLDHSYNAEYPNQESYIGVNAAGEHVYWTSCEYCGHSYRYLRQHLTERDAKASRMDLSLKEYQEEANYLLNREESNALNTTELYPGTFTMRQRNTAKVSAWADAYVNLALNDNLLDVSLLGSDYTKNITRLQFCSVAVRLAEELTGKTITPAPANTFSDTDSPYVLKAYAAGITSGISATEFGPNNLLDRQQMATFLHRTLQYVEKNSSYKYTDYTSKLSSYTDNSQIASWAKESMAFMNALDLITGTSATTLSPGTKCTIEQAVTVAERSIYAHQIGWYQVSPISNGPVLISTGYYTCFEESNTTLAPGDMVWVTGKLVGVLDLITTEPESTIDDCIHYSFIPAINPYTGQEMCLPYRDIVPVRN